jgi:hypothetical protein
VAVGGVKKAVTRDLCSVTRKRRIGLRGSEDSEGGRRRGESRQFVVGSWKKEVGGWLVSL